jgi:hypothetical protein
VVEIFAVAAMEAAKQHGFTVAAMEDVSSPLAPLLFI